MKNEIPLWKHYYFIMKNMPHNVGMWNIFYIWNIANNNARRLIDELKDSATGVSLSEIPACRRKIKTLAVHSRRLPAAKEIDKSAVAISILMATHVLSPCGYAIVRISIMNSRRPSLSGATNFPRYLWSFQQFFCDQLHIFPTRFLFLNSFVN